MVKNNIIFPLDINYLNVIFAAINTQLKKGCGYGGCILGCQER
ncbi:hypothetical protein SASC598P14_007730 [Snodgrassella alvi SCGC AB-598-P14]|nr:hypothetical protein SASC598P14_007730 [Snodgrassella alvi SCGC AB-598-P14]